MPTSPHAWGSVHFGKLSVRLGPDGSPDWKKQRWYFLSRRRFLDVANYFKELISTLKFREVEWFGQFFQKAAPRGSGLWRPLRKSPGKPRSLSVIWLYKGSVCSFLLGWNFCFSYMRCLLLLPRSVWNIYCFKPRDKAYSRDGLIFIAFPECAGCRSAGRVAAPAPRDRARSRVPGRSHAAAPAPRAAAFSLPGTLMFLCALRDFYRKNRVLPHKIFYSNSR